VVKEERGGQGGAFFTAACRGHHVCIEVVVIMHSMLHVKHVLWFGVGFWALDRLCRFGGCLLVMCSS
jgi:hypothetical protein